MKRWNGWGSDNISVHLPDLALDYLAKTMGAAEKSSPARYEDVLQKIPNGQHFSNPLIDEDKETRLRHARGQSLPDWISLRFGEIDRFPDGVALPKSEAEVAELVNFANENGICLIPYGGGTSVLGHINPPIQDRPIVTVGMQNFCQLEELNIKDFLATFGVGITGPYIEASLRAHGFTLGHFPQSFDYATLGGFIAARSSGQQSLYYGRIEDHFAGGTIITPLGRLEMNPYPASAAGPDLRQFVLGSEGRLGIITTAKVRIKRLPEHESFHAMFFPDWHLGVEAVREITQMRLPLSMLRLSDPIETKTSLLLSGKANLVRLANAYFAIRGMKDNKCMLIIGATGNRNIAKKALKYAVGIARSHKAIYIGTVVGKQWVKNRFRAAYLRNSIWDEGYALDTLETVIPLSNICRVKNEIIDKLQNGLEDIGEKVLAFAHVSHVYPTGGSIYVTYLYRIAKTAHETYERWRKLKSAASDIITRYGSTISHQHGVGLDHAQYLKLEKGEIGMKILSELIRTVDPKCIMNPKKLI